MGLKFERGGEVLGEIGFVVAARIQMKFVRDAARGQQLVERLRAHVESVVVLGAAVEINVHASGARAIADDSEWAIALPEGGIERVAERSAQARRRARFPVYRAFGYAAASQSARRYAR